MLTINNFVASFEIQIYYLQQIIYNFLYSELDHFTPYLFTLLLTGGLLTSINPCFISMLPLSISYISNKKKVNIAKYSFLAGLMSSLISIVGFSILLNNYYNKLILNIPIFSSLLIIIIGLNLLQILDLNSFTLHRLKINQFNINLTTSSFIIGLIFGLNSFSCSTPILATILLWLSNTHHILLGTIYITSYLIGYTIPIITLIKTTISYSNMKVISKTWNYIIPVSGSFILGIGIFSLLEKIFIY